MEWKRFRPVIDGVEYPSEYFINREFLNLPSETLPPWKGSIFEFLAGWFSDEDIISVMTSGSTGAPKVTHIPKLAMIQSAEATIRYLGLEDCQSALLCLSPDYIAGMMMIVRALVGDMNLVPVKPEGHPLTGAGLKKLPDFAAMVPAQVYNTLQNPQTAALLKEIKTVIVGGGEIPPGLERDIESLPNKVYATYGMTETVSHIALRRVSGPEKESFYTVLPGITVSTDARGCLVIQAPEIIKGEVVTNDLAEVRDEKSFIWRGRYDHIINRGGVKIIPEELEKILAGHIHNRFFVGGFPDRKLGEVPVLVIESAAVSEESLNSIKQFIKSNSKLKELIKDVVCMPQFIETENGKINRKMNLIQILKESNPC